MPRSLYNIAIDLNYYIYIYSCRFEILYIYIYIYIAVDLKYRDHAQSLEECLIF